MTAILKLDNLPSQTASRLRLAFAIAEGLELQAQIVDIGACFSPEFCEELFKPYKGSEMYRFDKFGIRQAYFRTENSIISFEVRGAMLPEHASKLEEALELERNGKTVRFRGSVLGTWQVGDVLYHVKE